MIYGVFINSRGRDYAGIIAAGIKTIETRYKNMLRELIGGQVAIVRTGCGQPVVIGYVTISAAGFCPADQFDNYRGRTFISPGDPFDIKPGKAGKWFYYLDNAERCKPYPLPENAKRHGRSYCKFEKGDN